MSPSPVVTENDTSMTASTVGMAKGIGEAQPKVKQTKRREPNDDLVSNCRPVHLLY